MLRSAAIDSAPEDINRLAARRNRSIRLAVSSSLLSKAGTILFQLVSIPIALRILGRAEFGLYATVNLTLSAVALLEIGMGPALTHGLTKARADSDFVGQRELASTAFFLILGIALLAGLALATALLTIPLSWIYGDRFAGREGMLRPALWAGLGLFLALFVLNVTERIREGHLEIAANNFWGAAGNVMAALLVGVGIHFVPQVWFLVIAVHGAATLSKLCNTAALWKKHPLMLPSLRHVRFGVAKGLVSDGLAFSVCCVVAVLIEFNLCGLLVGRSNGPYGVALYGVFINLTVMQLGFVIMLSAPTWPAVSEALARGDVPWAKKAAKRLYVYGVCFACCSAAGLFALGPILLPLWLGKDFTNLGRPLLACYGLYFIAYVWRHLNHAMMIGTGQVGKLVRIQLLESAIIAGLGWTALKFGGVQALFAAMGVVIIALTGTILPKRVAAALK